MKDIEKFSVKVGISKFFSSDRKVLPAVKDVLVSLMSDDLIDSD